MPEESEPSLCRRLCRRVVIATCIAFAFGVAFTPFIFAFVFTDAENVTTTDSTNAQLKVLFSLNFSRCIYPLFPNGRGGCFIPCRQSLSWFIHPSEVVPRKVLRYMLVVVALVSGIIISVAFVKLRKTHWKFPHILVWYLFFAMMGSGLLEIVLLIIGDEDVVCHSENLLNDLRDPALPCRVLGPLYHYLKISTVLWFTASCANIWWVVCFPTRARFFLQYSTRIHLIESLLCWTLPAFLVAINFAVEKTYLPIAYNGVCLPATQTLLLTTYALPSVISAFVFILLLMHMIFSLHEHSRFRKKAHAATSKDSSGGSAGKMVNDIQSLKVSFFVISMVIIVSSLLFGVALILSTSSADKVRDLLGEHLYCKTVIANSPNYSHVDSSILCPEKFRQYQYPALNIVQDCVYFIGALAVLHYAITLKAVRELLLHWLTLPLSLCSLTGGKKKDPSELRALPSESALTGPSISTAK